MPEGQVYGVIAKVSAELARCGIVKGQSNLEDGYSFRGIDDVYNRLGPLLAKYKLCFLPRMLERDCASVHASNGDMLTSVTVKAAFDLICAKDGSSHTVETYGEALDASDKATNKAMSAAYKYAAIQTFCIPTSEDNDADRRTHAVRSYAAAAITPVQGWKGWVDDLSLMATSCVSEEALSRLQQTYRAELRVLASSYRPLYEAFGAIVQARRAALKPVGVPGGGETSATGVIVDAEVSEPQPRKTARRRGASERAEPIHAAA